MKTTYLIWKNPSCNGINPDWQEITGREFYKLSKLPENKSRHFIKLYSASEDGSDGDIMIETTEKDYVAWRKEKDHADYVREQNQKKGYKTVYYHAFESDDGEAFGEELLPDKDCDIETKYIKSQEPKILKSLLSQLSDEERELVQYLYLSDEKGAVCGFEKLTGMSKSTVNRKQNAILGKLKKYFQF